MNGLGQLTRLETLAFLRSKSALFWTFAYPVVLLILLNALFGQAAARLAVEVDDRSAGGAQFVLQTLEARVEQIDGFELDFETVAADAPVGSGAVRVTFKQGFSENGGDLLIGYRPPITPETGSAISMITETVEHLNRVSVMPDPTLRVGFEQRDAAITPGSNGAHYLITGLAALTIITTALFGFTGVLIQMRHAGALKPFQIMPVTKRDYIVAFSASRAIVLLVFSILFILVANLVYQAGIRLDPVTVGLAILVSGVGIFAFLGMGLALAAFITKPATGQNIPVIFLSDLFIPISAMPDWLQTLVSWSPIYFFVNLLRGILEGGALGAEERATLAILFALGAGTFWIAMRAFKWRTA